MKALTPANMGQPLEYRAVGTKLRQPSHPGGRQEGQQHDPIIRGNQQGNCSEGDRKD